jgi:DHA1 family bicyclomycin/chloramphenicol resistance-like MFS transporter
MKLSHTRRICLIVFLGIMSAMAPLATDMYLPSLPTVQSDLGISASLTQLTLTMTLIGMALGQIFSGPISDMCGRKTPMLVGMIVFTAASAGCAFVTNIGLFLVLRFIQGFAGASGIVISRAIARDVCEGPELTRFYAILMMVNGLAPILAPVIGGQLLLFTSWRGVFILLIIVGIVQAVSTCIYRETLPKEDRIHGVIDSYSKYPKLLHDRYFLGHCLLQSFIFGAFFSYLGGSAFLFQNVYHVSPQAFSLIFAAIGTGLMLIGALPARLAGRVPDIIMLKYSVIIPLLGSVLLLAGFMLQASIWYTFVILFITIVPLSVLGASSFSLALSRQGKNAGSASALIGFFSMILGGCLMPLVGIAGSDTALPLGGIMLCCYILALIVFHTLIAPDHQAELHPQTK